MGCYFLGCFGFSSRRRPRRHDTAIVTRQHHSKGGSYELLDSVSINLDIEQEDPIVADSIRQSINKASSSLKSKIRKRVRFNLNVQTYEPLPSEESNDDLEVIKGNTREGEEEQKGSCSILKWGSYPSNYRYRSYFEQEEEEEEEAAEEFLYDEIDLDDDEDDYENDNDEEEEDNNYGHDDEAIDGSKQDHDEILKQFKPLSLISEKTENSAGVNRSGRDRSQYVQSVLNPIENLSQWKAVKARGVRPPSKSQRKENFVADRQRSSQNSRFSSSNLTQDGAVDASLSNWLGSQSNSASNKSINPDVAVSLCKHSSI